jgi:phospholipase/carboxylesterase
MGLSFPRKLMILKYRYREPEKASGEIEKSPLLLLLHGIGADENDLFGIAPFLDPRFFVASARAPFSLSYGGYAWFEIYMEPGNISINIKQFLESKSMIHQFIGELITKHNLDADRIYLCGFSQGAMISLSSVLTEPEKFAGLVAMSGRSAAEMMPAPESFERLKDFPILVTHGVYDPVLPIDNGRETKELLSRLPVDLEYKEYQMGHEISEDSLGDVSEWLGKRLDLQQ